jgi:tetratricopeptide (TPR) repeat protein
MRSVTVSLAVALVLLGPARALAQHEHEHDHAHEVPESFGTIHFPTSCSPKLASDFERAVAMLHSFAYPEAAQAFADVAARDPGCAMAQWGIAMSYFHTIWGPPTADEFAAGRAAAEKATALAPRVSAREQDLIAAIAAYYRGDGIPHATRVATFEQAMAAAAQRSPDDHEVQIFYALSILGVAYNSPPDKTYARQKQAAAILNRLLPLEPDHPGIAHYMIHSFDYPELAELAVPAARAYAKIAPAAPHALHMPSHIFTRLGMWQESIESNLASAAAARALMARTHPGATAYEGLHAMDYLEYAYLQTGQDAMARAIVDSLAQIASLDAPAFQAGYALAAIPARFALERRDWKAAAALGTRPAGFPWEKYPYAEAIVHLARAVGAAHTGDLATVRQATARLDTIQAGLRGQKGFDWATQVEIQHREAQAWLAYAEKKRDEAVTLMRAAADLEDSTDKHPVTPGAILPAREQLADLLYELNRPDAALSEYEASLKLAPARLNSYLGAAQAAGRSGQADKAKLYKDRLLAMCVGSVPDRVAAARLGK